MHMTGRDSGSADTAWQTEHGRQNMASLVAGVPARVRTHEVTKQVEYIGDVQNLVEKLSDLPAGGQVLMGPLTYQRIYGRLEEFRIHSLQQAYEQPSRAPGHLRGARARRRMSGALSSVRKAVKVFGRSGSTSFTSRKTSASSMQDADIYQHQLDLHEDVEVCAHLHNMSVVACISKLCMCSLSCWELHSHWELTMFVRAAHSLSQLLCLVGLH